MKTWPAITAQLMQDQSALLREKALFIISDEALSRRRVDIFITGIRCPMTLERSARMLLHDLDKEQQELVALCNKFNSQSLEREAIIKTKLFRKIVRRVDVARDLFFFETFGGGGASDVFGDVQALENSTVTSSICRLTEEISAYELPSEFNKSYIQGRVRHIINETKNILWKRRSDVGLLYQKRIPIQLLDPPETTKDRIINWKEHGFSPKIIAHRDSFTVTLPDFCVRALRECFERKQKEWQKRFSQEIMDKYNFPEEHHSKEFAVDRIRDNMFTILNSMQPNPLHRDPIIYHEDGDWTVVIDQYAHYPKEKDIVRAVKEHYKILGNSHGLFINDN